MPEKKKNKVTFGLSNVFIWPIVSVSDDGVPTYGTGFWFRGARELSLDAEGSADPWYADDVIYYQGDSNNGYSGSITMADVIEDFQQNILGYEVDKNGAVFENANTPTKEFAMAFEFKGDQAHRRHLLYRVKAQRPGLASSTKEDSVEPNTSEINITSTPRIDNGYVKASCNEGDACYAGWYGETPYEKDASVTA